MALLSFDKQSASSIARPHPGAILLQLRSFDAPGSGHTACSPTAARSRLIFQRQGFVVPRSSLFAGEERHDSDEPRQAEYEVQRDGSRALRYGIHSPVRTPYSDARHATAPAFFLGTVAAFVSLMTSRLAAVRERIAKLHAEAGSPDHPQWKVARKRLLLRTTFLTDAILITLCSGIAATLLLTILFVAQFLGLAYAYGAAGAVHRGHFTAWRGAAVLPREARLAREEASELPPLAADGGS
jgi:hypothetical protein